MITAVQYSLLQGTNSITDPQLANVVVLKVTREKKVFFSTGAARPPADNEYYYDSGIGYVGFLNYAESFLGIGVVTGERILVIYKS